MRDDFRIPDLTFPGIAFGPNENPWNLDILLYKGGAASSARKVRELIESGALGDPLFDRIPLVVKIHEVINDGHSQGGSRDSTEQAIGVVRQLFSFCDRTDRLLTTELVVQNYSAWAAWLYHRMKLPKQARGPDGYKRLAPRTAYQYAAFVGTILDRALDRHTRLIETTSIPPPTKKKTAIGVQAEKQSLADTFALGHLVQDLCDGIDLAMVRRDEAKHEIPLRTGGAFFWNGKVKMGTYNFTSSETAAPRTQYALVNLRIESELLMFIGQTGINLKQAVNSEFRHFFYVSHLDGYKVKDYKRRREGSVLFEIFKEYKQHFERYLNWRAALFPDSTYLFPLIAEAGVRQDTRFSNGRVKAVCKDVGINYVPPQQLRNTRVNWLLRQSGDLEQTAEMAQHTKETLIRVYHRPSLQRAMAESTRFWSKYDPHQNRTLSLAPGACSGSPQSTPDRPSNAAEPDCEKASGCLWCENHRDVDSFDYVWALSSFMHLKGIELSKSGPPKPGVSALPPAKMAMDRILEKLRWFEESNEKRRNWVEEAQARIAEETFHPDFQAAILDLGAFA